MQKITQFKVLEDYRVELSFSDGFRGVVDLSDLTGRGVFSAWEDYAEFSKAGIGDAGELVWPGGIDLCPDALYLRASGKKPEDIFPALKQELSYA
jgi:hypothetical protein